MEPGIAALVARELAKLAGGALAKRLMTPPAAGAKLASDPVELRRKWRRGSDVDELTDRDVERLVRDLLLRVIDQVPQLLHLDDGPVVQAALVRTLTATGTLTADSVQDAGLDVLRFTDRLRRAEPPDDLPALSPDGRELYDSVLHACAVNIIDFFTQTPSFTARTLVEQSNRLEKVLGDANGFRERYLAYVEPVLDEQQLFGLRLRADMQTYKLSTAYVSLSMEWVDQADHPIGKRANRDASRAAKAVDRLGPEDILVEHGRLIIDGPAGSGKTTLLKRIALHAIRGEFPGSLHSWNSLVPFLLRVRQFADVEFPQPEAFLETTAGPLQGEMPHRWVTELLRSGSALLLIDGVDEVPTSRRPALMEWITGLSRAYPTARIVVTSRPGAIEEYRSRLQSAGFSGARMEPMSQSQVADFVTLWHDAYGRNVGQVERITARSSALISAIDSRRDLARMATSPLLCAMLCALNINSNSWLPRERTRLYRDALEMLLERRDREQQISVSAVMLDSQYIEPILARLAFWMLLNGRRTITDEQAVRQIGELLPRIRHSLGAAEALSSQDVLDHVVSRSGLLQRSSEVTLEFRHPSFQDYLSAAEVFRQDQVDHLIRQAHDPLYHDVVIMAVAQSQSDPKRQSEFLRGLTSRAATDSEYSRELWLLAAAAIADAGLVDPDIERVIAEATTSLLPPQDLDQAYEIAEAGEFALDLLNEVVDNTPLSSAEAAAAVRAACVVDAPESVRLLKKLVAYAPGTPLVQSELLLGWRSAIDPALYEREVLRAVDFSQASFHAGHQSDLELFRHLRAIRILSVGEWCTNEDIRAIENLDQLEELRIANSHVDNLDFLAKWPELRSLDISRTRVTGTASLRLAARLVSLSLRQCSVDDVAALSDLSKLQSCVLSETKIESLDGLGRLPELKDLDVGKTPVKSLRGLSGARALTQLSIAGCPVDDLGPLAGAAHLETLEMGGTGMRSLEPLNGMAELRKLDAHMCDLTDLAPLAGCTKLQDLDIGSTLCDSLEPLLGLPNLRRLDISWTKVTSLHDRVPSRLRELNISGTRIDDLRPLVGLPYLRKLCLDERQRTLPGVSALTHQYHLDLVGASLW